MLSTITFDRNKTINNSAHWATFREVMAKKTRPLFRRMYIAGVQAGAALMPGVKVKAIGEKVTDPATLTLDLEQITKAADGAIEDYLSSFLTNIGDSSKQQLGEAIQRARADGTGIEGVLPTAARLYGKERAQTIAQTELTNLMGMGMQAAYSAAGLSMWEWQTVQDSFVDEECDVLDGEQFDMDTIFEAAHPRCRCFPKPVLDSFVDEQKFNPNHDELGRFASGDSMAEPLAKDIFTRASAAEPAITSDMHGVAKAAGGKLTGLAFRLKTQESLARKIKDDNKHRELVTETVQHVASKISDSVRYTIQFPGKKYTAGVQRSVAEMHAKGYVAKGRQKVEWGPNARPGYRGVNTKFADPRTGQILEMQFHTPASFAAKEANHLIYDKTRVMSDKNPQKAILVDQMNRRSMGVAVPPNVDQLHHLFR